MPPSIPNHRSFSDSAGEMLGLLSSCPALHMSPPVSGARRSLSPRMNFFDKAQEAFGAGDKPLVGGDRVTPFDRWLGLDKELESEKIERVGNSGVTFIDPNDVSSYYTVSLTKPMGIGFVENSGDPDEDGVGSKWSLTALWRYG